MRKKPIIVVVFVCLLILAAPISLSSANVPPRDEVAKAKITVFSPHNNQNISSNYLLVHFSVETPVEEIYAFGYPKADYIPKETAGKAGVILDHQTGRSTHISIPILYNLSQRVANYSCLLTNLTQGTHSLYISTSGSYHDSADVVVGVYSNSKTVEFTVLYDSQTADSSPLPQNTELYSKSALIGGVIALTVVTLFLVFYFMNKKTQKKADALR